MKKLKIISLLLIALSLNSVVANAKVNITKNKDGSVVITDTKTESVIEISNDDGSPVTDEQIARELADNDDNDDTTTSTTESTTISTTESTYTLNPIQNGWTQDSNGYWYYYVNGVLQTGWVEYNGYWYYLESNGIMATNQWVLKLSDTKNIHQMYEVLDKYYVDWDGKYIANPTSDDQHEPKYGQITLSHPNSGGYYNWKFGTQKFKYNSKLNTWENEKILVGSSETSTVLGMDTDWNEFYKYAKEYFKPTDKGTDGEEREVTVWVYLGDKSS